METWITPDIEELTIAETANGWMDSSIEYESVSNDSKASQNS